MTNSPFQVLLVGRKEQLPADVFSSEAQSFPPELQAEVASALSEAMSRLDEKGYDAVACWAEHDGELTAVLEIRKAFPKIPIVFFASKDDRRIQGLARRAGATRTSGPVRDGAALSGYLLEVLRSHHLRHDLLRQARRAQSKGAEILALAQETSTLTRDLQATHLERKVQLFEPLLVEDDRDQAFLMLRAFEKAGVRAPHPVLRSGEEAIRYLAARRDESALPTLVLLDVGLVGKSGLDVLAWMMSDPVLSRIPVVMLSSSNNPAHVNRAYELGAKSFLAKPTGMHALVELVQMLKSKWGKADGTLGQP